MTSIQSAGGVSSEVEERLKDLDATKNEDQVQIGVKEEELSPLEAEKKKVTFVEEQVKFPPRLGSESRFSTVEPYGFSENDESVCVSCKTSGKVDTNSVKAKYKKLEKNNASGAARRRVSSTPDSTISSNSSMGINTINISKSPLLQDHSADSRQTSKSPMRKLFNRPRLPKNSSFEFSGSPMRCRGKASVKETPSKGSISLQEVPDSCPFYDDLLEQVIEPRNMFATSQKILSKWRSLLQKKGLYRTGSLASKSTLQKSFGEVFDLPNVFNWTSSRVCAWLEMIGLSKYSEFFLQNGVDGATLLELSRTQFRTGLNVLDERHLMSLQIGVVTLLCQRKIKSAKRFFEDWNLEKTLKWVDDRGFSILKPLFKKHAIHGGILLFIETDFLIDKILQLHTITKSTVVRESLSASIKRAKEIEATTYWRRKGKRVRRTDDVLDWRLDEVETWLKSVSVGHRIESFRDHCVNGTLLLKLNYEMMQEMGLSEIMSIVLIKALNTLKRERRNVSNLKDKHKSTRVSSEISDDSSSARKNIAHAAFEDFKRIENGYRESLEELRKRSLSGSGSIDAEVEEQEANDRPPEVHIDSDFN